jgi:hypothetical protein
METPNENEEASRDTNRRTLLPATKLRFSSDSSRKSFVCVFSPSKSLRINSFEQHHHHHQEQQKFFCVAFDFYWAQFGGFDREHMMMMMMMMPVMPKLWSRKMSIS